MSQELADQKQVLHHYLNTLLTDNSINQAEDFLQNILDDEVSAPTGFAEQQQNYVFFRVGKMKCAVPLSEFSGVQQISLTLSSDSWYQGKDEASVDEIQWVDLAQLAGVNTEAREQAVEKSLVLCKKGKLGILCDELLEPIALQPGDIQFKTDSTKRKWLHGVASKQKLVIVDVDAIEQMLAEEESV